MSNARDVAMGQAAMAQAAMAAQLGYGYPRIESVDDAKQALSTRAKELREKLNMVPKWKAELDRIERMLEADK